MKKRLIKVLAAALLPILLTGCWQEEPDNQETSLLQPGEEIQTDSTETRVVLPEIFSLPYAPDQSLDPVTCGDGMQQVVSSLVCEGLFRLGTDFEPEELLCASYTYDTAALTYTFLLRGGVTFSDGSPLTAADVKATLDRARHSERYGARLADVTAITAGDDAVTITLASPNSGFPALLDIPIVKSGTENAPIGTGPYLFSVEGSDAYLVANQSWWQGDGQPVERIALVEANDQDTMLYRFTSHDVQLITADLTGTNPVSATGNISYLDADTTVLQYIGCNVSRAPLDSADFRHALSLGLDRDSATSAFLSGHGKAAQFPVSPVSPLYPESLEERYSLDDFTAALTASGYTAERTLTLLVNEENSFKSAIAEEIAETFTNAGVPITVQILPWDAYTAALASGDFDLYYGEVKLTADWDLSSLLGTGGSLNYGGWSDTRTDQLLAAYAAATDRSAAMEQLCKYLQAQSPIFPVCFKSTSVLLQANVLDGLAPTAAEPFYSLTDCVIHLRQS
jgi:peptide/nickel transport system substrate-binding protein